MLLVTTSLAAQTLSHIFSVYRRIPSVDMQARTFSIGLRFVSLLVGNVFGVKVSSVKVNHSKKYRVRNLCGKDLQPIHVGSRRRALGKQSGGRNIVVNVSLVTGVCSLSSCLTVRALTYVLRTGAALSASLSNWVLFLSLLLLTLRSDSIKAFLPLPTPVHATTEVHTLDTTEVDPQKPSSDMPPRVGDTSSP